MCRNGKVDHFNSLFKINKNLIFVKKSIDCKNTVIDSENYILPFVSLKLMYAICMI